MEKDDPTGKGDTMGKKGDTTEKATRWERQGSGERGKHWERRQGKRIKWGMAMGKGEKTGKGNG